MVEVNGTSLLCCMADVETQYCMQAYFSVWLCSICG